MLEAAGVTEPAAPPPPEVIDVSTLTPMMKQYLEVKAGNPPVLNDARIAEIASRAAARVVGEQNVVSPEPTMGGEDMAIYFEQVPGCFVFVGNGKDSAPLHNPSYDFNDNGLLHGARFHAAIARKRLGPAE